MDYIRKTLDHSAKLNGPMIGVDMANINCKGGIHHGQFLLYKPLLQRKPMKRYEYWQAVGCST